MSIVGVREPSVNLRKAFETRAFTPERVRKFLVYEIPLRVNSPDKVDRARLVLPEDLSQSEAERLCNIIRSLAMPS